VGEFSIDVVPGKTSYIFTLKNLPPGKYYTTTPTAVLCNGNTVVAYFEPPLINVIAGDTFDVNVTLKAEPNHTVTFKQIPYPECQNKIESYVENLSSSCAKYQSK
jgi:hypothetical protein